MLTLRSGKTPLNLGLQAIGTSVGAHNPAISEDLLTSVLDDLIRDEQHDGALLLMSQHPLLLGHLRNHADLKASFIDNSDFRRCYPRLAFHLQNRRERARSLGMLEMANSAPADTLEERGARLVEERLRQIRQESQSHAIGAPFR